MTYATLEALGGMVVSRAPGEVSLSVGLEVVPHRASGGLIQLR